MDVCNFIGIPLPGGSHASGTLRTLVGVSRLSVIFMYFTVNYILHPTDWQIKCDELNLIER